MSQIGNVVYGKKMSYELLDLVAGGTHGSMGSVYKARGSDGKEYAIKIPSTFDDQDVKHIPHTFRWLWKKNRLEADTLRQLTSKKIPSVIRYIDESNDPKLREIVDEHGERDYETDFFTVIELIDGKSLMSYVSANGRLGQDEVIKISLQILMTLKFIHENGVLHRDIKPANIMIKRDGTIVLIDFGTAKLLGREAGSDPVEGSVTGTRNYSCHHQDHALPLGAEQQSSAACDIYAVGRTIFNLLTDNSPKRYTKVNDAAGNSLISTHPNHLNHYAPQIDDAGKTLLHKYCTPEFENLLYDILEPDHQNITNAKVVIERLRKIKLQNKSKPIRIGTKKPKKKRQPNVGGPPIPPVGISLNPHIIFAGHAGVSGRFPIADTDNTNTMIGGNHNVVRCKANFGTPGAIHCNDIQQGINIPIGTATCPSKNCQGCDNLAHEVPRHHIRIWQTGGNYKIRINSDEAAGVKPQWDTEWSILRNKVTEDLEDGDEIAVLYVEPTSEIPITFTFHKQ